MANNASFVNVANNRFTRKWGGSETTVDPYISGYFHTYWQYLPSSLSTSIGIPGGTATIGDDVNIKTILQSACLAVTIPGATVNKAEFTGLGGIKWAVPTNVEWDNTVTIKFLEFSSLPILAIIHGWVRLIRDYRTGVSHVLKGSSIYHKSNYSGTMLYWTTRPDTYMIEYYAAITGMFPLKDPTDQYGGDLATNDKLELDLDFNADYIFHESWVRSACDSKQDEFIDGATYSGTTVSDWETNAGL